MARPLIEARLDVCAKRTLAGVNLAHHANQIVGKRVLQEIGRGAGFECPVDVLIPVMLPTDTQDRRFGRQMPHVEEGGVKSGSSSRSTTSSVTSSSATKTHR
jgi:hypothetical protein